MSAADKTKLDSIAANANNYSLPVATSSARGGIKIGFSQSDQKYPVQLSSEKAYVEVPWTDTGATSIDTTGSGNAVTSASYDASTRKITLTKEYITRLYSDNNTGYVNFYDENKTSGTGVSYYFRRPNQHATSDDSYCLGSDTYRWNKAYLENLILSNPLPISYGGTGQTTGVEASKAMVLPSLSSSTPSGTLDTTARLYALKYDNNYKLCTSIPVFTKSGSSAAAGLVPSPSTTEGTTKYLREDGNWKNIYSLYSSDDQGRVLMAKESSVTDHGVYYFRHNNNKTTGNVDDIYYLGTANYPWSKSFIKELKIDTLKAIDSKISIDNQVSVLGDLLLGNDGSSEEQHDLYIRRKVGGVLKSARSYWHSDGHYVIQAASDNAVKNYMYLKDDKTEFKQPVAINSGGTGASTAKAARANLFSGLSGTTSGNKFKAVFNSTDDALYTTIPYASKDNIGLLNTEKQEISGYKFFHNYLFAPINVAKGTTPSTTTTNALIFTDNNINSDKKYRYSMVCGQVYKESRDSTIGLYVYQASDPSVNSNLTDGATKNASLVLHAPNETEEVPYISTNNIEYIKTKRFAVNTLSYGTSAPAAADGIVTGQIYYHIID